jgi:hypothetical protein
MTACGIDDQGSIPNRGSNFFFNTTSSPIVENTHPPIQFLSEALSSGVHRPEREVGHLPHLSASTVICLQIPTTF